MNPAAQREALHEMVKDSIKYLLPEGGEMEVCEWGEVNKLIRAFQEKYNDPGCQGLPYDPKTFKIKLLAIKEK